MIIKENTTFTLHTKNTTYQMQVDRFGFLLHLYYGRRAEGCMDYLLIRDDRAFSAVPEDAGGDRTWPLDYLPQEFPAAGSGDYRSPAIRIKNENGTYSCDFRYKSSVIQKGKYGLPGLPAVYAGEDEAETLKILLEDPATGVQAELLYGVLPDCDIITRSVRVINNGDGRICLDKIQSACLDFVHGDYELVSFYGRHAMERNFQRNPIAHGNQVLGSRRGTSSHQYNPVMLLAQKDTTERAGSCYALSLVYSGAFKGEAERDQYNQTRVLLGMQEEMFCYPLEKGEIFSAPEVVMTYTAQGLNRLSQNLHRCFRQHLCRGKYKEQVRPVLVNSWEASYFDFTGDSLCALAAQAKEAGAELLVLDDGWFGRRADDNSSLGDWYVNEEKLGKTLGELIGRINGMGMKFGIWIEPECISEDSDLYRAHPGWALAVPGRKPVRGRNQLVLDFSRKEVVDHIYGQISRILDMGNIEYIKWDMNRSICDVYSASGREPGRVLYDYYLGLYDFLERIVQNYPDILLEGCSGGGGRFDAGMLYYTPQIWCSDNTDAVDRLRIQYGTSFAYPVSAVGAHVSAVPNHQTGRSVPMKTRGIAAMAGTFGYELDFGKLTEEEKNEVKEQIAVFHRYAPLIQNGRYYRLTNPFEEETAAWAFVSEDGREVLFQAVMQELHGNMPARYVVLQGLREDALYEEPETGKKYSGSALMECGIPVPAAVPAGEYGSCQIYLCQTPLP